MFKVIYKMSLLYYVLAFFILFTCIDFKVLYVLKLKYLSLYADSPRLQHRILLYDYLAHLQPKEAKWWALLADNYARWGDHPDAVDAHRKAVSINPQEKSD